MEHFAVAQCHRKEHNGKVDRKENRVRSYIIMKMVQIVIPVCSIGIIAQCRSWENISIEGQTPA
jgi:hypothetical protein